MADTDKAAEEKKETVEVKAEKKVTEKAVETPVNTGEAKGGEEKTAVAEADASGTKEDTTELQEPKVRQAFLEKFKIKKSKKTEPTVEKAQKTTDAATAEAIYKELAEIKSNDYWVLRLRKKTLLVIGGVAIVLMWVVIVAGWGIETYKPEWAFWNATEQETVVEENQPEPEQPMIRIRVRDNNPDPSLAQRIAGLLQNSGFEGIEVVDDQASDYVGIMVIAKAQERELQQELEELLREQFELSSPSAQLSTDSDYNAVVLVGQTTAATASGERENNSE